MTGIDRTSHKSLTIKRDRWVKPRSRCTRWVDGIGSGVIYGVHAIDLKNVARGIVERVFCVQGKGGLTPPPRPVEGCIDKLQNVRAMLLQNLLPTTVVPRGVYHLLYRGRRQVLYKRAGESLVQRPLHSGDAVVSTFVKAEKVNFTAKPDPAPRVIQPRSPRYNFEVGRYLKLFEKEVLRGFIRTFSYPVVLKGFNASDVAKHMRANWDHFKDPVAVGLDASRFDQHVSYEMLEFEHSIYNAVFKSPELARLLRMQLVNRGVARVGEWRVDYTVRGCRMSGDMNTGMGNCLLMSLMVLGYFEQEHPRGVDAVRLSNNGDDCVVFIAREDLPFMAGISVWFKGLGFTLTEEEPVDVFERVVFCQTQPVLTSTGWRMVRDPRTAPSKDAMSVYGWDTEADFTQWCHDIGQCGLQLCRGVPFWEQHYRELLKYGVDSKRGQRLVEETGMWHNAKGVVGGEVTPEARASFWRAFGMLPSLQIALERRQLQLATDPKSGLIKPTINNYSSNALSIWANATR